MVTALQAKHHRLIDAAADLVPEHKRAVFFGHVRAALAAERDALSDRRFKQTLCNVLSRFGVAVRVSYFERQPWGGKNNAAGAMAATATRART
jgi:hypothetical protein